MVGQDRHVLAAQTKGQESDVTGARKATCTHPMRPPSPSAALARGPLHQGCELRLLSSGHRDDEAEQGVGAGAFSQTGQGVLSEKKVHPSSQRLEAPSQGAQRWTEQEVLTASSQRPPHVVMNMATTRRRLSLPRHSIPRGLRRVSQGVQTDVDDRSIWRRM